MVMRICSHPLRPKGRRSFILRPTRRRPARNITTPHVQRGRRGVKWERGTSHGTSAQTSMTRGGQRLGLTNTVGSRLRIALADNHTLCGRPSIQIVFFWRFGLI